LTHAKGNLGLSAWLPSARFALRSQGKQTKKDEKRGSEALGLKNGGNARGRGRMFGKGKKGRGMLIRLLTWWVSDSDRPSVVRGLLGGVKKDLCSVCHWVWKGFVG